jgi:hypothetical protein
VRNETKNGKERSEVVGIEPNCLYQGDIGFKDLDKSIDFPYNQNEKGKPKLPFF